MFMKEIFEVRIEEKIDPVIKVGERQNDKKLAGEIANYIVTPALEKFFDEVLEEYTDTLHSSTDEIGVWISGYFGSGKSHLAKILSLVLENKSLDSISAAERFKNRLPPNDPRTSSIIRHLSRVPHCDTRVLAFNLNTLIGSKETPLPHILLHQYYLSKGYSSNLVFAKVIESELDKMGKLDDFHKEAERLTQKSWADIQKNPTFFMKKLYEAVCSVAPDNFTSPEEVQTALKNAQSGEVYNIQFLVTTFLDDLNAREAATTKPCRLMLVMDETGQWIGDDGDRLHLLQGLVEEAGSRGKGKIWITVTTHEDMGSIIQNARGLKTDMKKIEDRFGFRISLTTENIERVLEDRLLKKTVAGRDEVLSVYRENSGVLRGMGQLENTLQILPDCTEESFQKFYPFFPYQIHLIPEVVKSLRSSGGRGEQLSGSTRTLLAITQDIITDGRRKYLQDPVGAVVSFDELYGNLEGNEINPDVRKELARISEVVPGATDLTRRVAEVLYLIRDISYIPKSVGNIARLLVESTDDDLPEIIRRITPELNKLVKAKLVAKIGEEYDYLTKEGRNFEEEVLDIKGSLRWADVLQGVSKVGVQELLGFTTVRLMDWDCPVRIQFDDVVLAREGDVTIHLHSPLARLQGLTISDVEENSTHRDYEHTIFVYSGLVPHLDEAIKYYVAMDRVIGLWKGDPHKSGEAHRLATEREDIDLKKQRDNIRDSILEGLRTSQIVFRGSSQSLLIKGDQKPSDALRAALSQFMPKIYLKYDKVPYRPQKEQNAVVDVLRGDKTTSADLRGLKIYDKAGGIDKDCPLLSEIRLFMSQKQAEPRKERVLGKDLLDKFTHPPYGWHQGAVRIGVAALVRTGDMKAIIEKKVYTNPMDAALQDNLKNVKDFARVQLELDEIPLNPTDLTQARQVLIHLMGKRKIDETPAGIAQSMKEFTGQMIRNIDDTLRWAEPARLPLPQEFSEGEGIFRDFTLLTNPNHVIREILEKKDRLKGSVAAIRAAESFVKQWAQAFIDMREYATALDAIEYRLSEEGQARTFLKNWRDAIDQKSLIDSEVWKILQQAKLGAETELTGCISAWRIEAHEEVDRVEKEVQRLYAEVDLRGKYDEHGCKARLDEVRKEIDDETAIPRLANMVNTIKPKLSRIIDSAKKDIESLKPRGVKEKKPTERLKLLEGTQPRIIKTVPEWESFRDDLDSKVKRILDYGRSVELS